MQSNSDLGASFEPKEVQQDGSVAHSEEAGFSSRWAFLITAIGCAVGFGNIWRFPYLVYSYGGLAFLIPYVICVFLIVMPVCILEMAAGQFGRGGQVQAFSRLGVRPRAGGMVAFVGFNICCYYPLLLVWSLVYLANCLQPNLPWRVEDGLSEVCEAVTTIAECTIEGCKWNKRDEMCVADLLKPANDFFRDGCFAFSDVDAGDHLAGFTGMSGWNVLCMFISWTANILGIIAGAKVLGYVMYITMSLPTIFILILVIVGATLEGAGTGIVEYIGKFDGSKLTTSAWTVAVSQGVFSVGIAQGCYTAFSSHNKRDQNFVEDALTIVTADTVFSLLSGFSVFAVIGHLAYTAGDEIADLPLNGISLAFQTYPVGLLSIPGAGANILTALFFFALWLLGLDTLLGLTESQVLILVNSRFGRRIGIKRWHATLGFSFFYFAVPGLLLSTNLGYFLLDTMDAYGAISQSFGCGSEAFIVGWLYLSSYAIDKVGYWPHAIHCGTFVLGGILFGILSSTVSGVVGVCVGIGVLVIGFVIAFFMCNKEDPDGNPYSITDRLYYLSIYNVEPFRKMCNEKACKGAFFHLPILWSIFIKYLIPFVILYLVFSGITDPEVMYSRPSDAESPYPWYIFFLGQLFPLLVSLSIVVFIIYPEAMTFLLPPGADDAEAIENVMGIEFKPLCERNDALPITASELANQEMVRNIDENQNDKA